MKGIMWLGPRQMNQQDLPLPEPLANEVIVQVAAVGICGSELSGFLGNNSLRVPPLIMGHEFAGQIAELGDYVTNLHVGDAVTVNPLISCGACTFCRLGLENLCEARQLIGAHRPGAFAEFVAVPAANCVRLPVGVDMVTGSLAEPLACSVRATQVGRVAEGNRVLVLGAGTIGLMCIKAVRQVGASVVLAVDVNEGRLATAKAWGAELALNAHGDNLAEQAHKLTNGLGVDVVIDAVGATTTRQAAVRCVRSGGTVVLVGLHEEQSTLEANYVIRSEIHVTGSFAYTPADFDQALGILAAGYIQPEGSWLEERELAACADSFVELVDAPPAVAKIVLRP